jgi:hypothetical protein
MPFQSKAQQRFMFSQHPDIAEEWAHKGPKGYIKRLPERIRSNKDRRKANRAVKESVGYADYASMMLLGIIPND